ncbi:MAG: putative toxin-antitoxin system toxin component, PIN family [Candidatus Riflebacteria bacterium RBG_13_59_9]|nr:MAG: putative toxin-antitoxin system toxin component, PIN family [Candidatus Riflebacteria bacterium RBG_13_59_9]
MKVVIDTNVFVSSLLNPEGSPRKVIDLWRFEKITLCLSKAILAEYFELLGRFDLTEKPMGEHFVRLFQLRYNQVFIASPEAISVVHEDPHDDKFIECAVGAGADYIVSGDRHLLKLKSYKGIPIVTPAELLKSVG